MELIVGLGNPGKTYVGTRHNAGFAAVDALAKDMNVSWKESIKHHAHIADIKEGDARVVLAKPTTYMNLSGEAVQRLASFYHLTPDHIWIISDDIALKPGTVRIRRGGSAGGHNGLQSVIDHLGADFGRIRIGVGKHPVSIPQASWVLMAPEEEDKKLIATATRSLLDLLKDTLLKGNSLPTTTTS